MPKHIGAIQFDKFHRFKWILCFSCKLRINHTMPGKCACDWKLYLTITLYNDIWCSMAKDYRSPVIFHTVPAWKKKKIGRYSYSIRDTNDKGRVEYIVHIVGCRNEISCCVFLFDLNDIAFQALHDRVWWTFVVQTGERVHCQISMQQQQTAKLYIPHSFSVPTFIMMRRII